MYEVAHVGIVVKDAQISSKFYCDVLGCKLYETVDSAELKLIMLKAGCQTIELVQYFKDKERERGAGVVDHIAFIVPDMDMALEQLALHNVPLLQDKPKVLPDKKIMFFSGPDGERLEFIENLPI